MGARARQRHDNRTAPPRHAHLGAEKAPGIAFLPLDRDVLLLSTRLPGAMHNDPADRMLIAASQLYSLPLITADSLIIDYAAAHPGTTVIDARPKRAAPRSRRRSTRR